MSKDLKDEKTRAEIEKIRNSDKRETVGMVLKILLGVVTIAGGVVTIAAKIIEMAEES